MAGRGYRVLNVAEKPSVAKEVSRLLSGGQARRENTWYACIFELVEAADQYI